MPAPAGPSRASNKPKAKRRRSASSSDDDYTPLPSRRPPRRPPTSRRERDSSSPEVELDDVFLAVDASRRQPRAMSKTHFDYVPERDAEGNLERRSTRADARHSPLAPHLPLPGPLCPRRSSLSASLVLQQPDDPEDFRHAIKAWLDGSGPALHFSDDIVTPGSSVPVKVEKVLNVYHCIVHTSASPDLVRQICPLLRAAKSPDFACTPCPCPLHMGHNVRHTPWTYNSAKRGGLDLVALLTMLAILEHGHDNGEVDSITALMCRVSEHHRASARRTYISDADKIRELADWKTVKEALGGKGPWAAQLPPSDIEREVSRFSPRASKTIVDDSHELLTVAIDTIRLFERAEIARLPALGHAAVKIPRTAACYRRFRKAANPTEKPPKRRGKARGPQQDYVCYNPQCQKRSDNTSRWSAVPGIPVSQAPFTVALSQV
ncbi:uncharacterized protein EHS24_001941 [Apiotrichum porosum]|uniref:Uncharacterized protein n=1 Tax=Apiotrichum porosum TaxID=105984 RepID=A0A427XJS5_9TREE|nr:uncharacterized protein EHS24_001941 [Apiotrichum porosum]RSH79014.1 hypothetical protein EHS24_001941 [Apiotrichum porosum]